MAEEAEPMTLKIPSTLIDDLRDEPLFDATEAMASLAHVAVPAAQPLPFPTQLPTQLPTQMTMQTPMQMPFLPQQSLYQGFPPANPFGYPPRNTLVLPRTSHSIYISLLLLKARNMPLGILIHFFSCTPQILSHGHSCYHR